MTGIRTLAGYADTSSHGRLRLVISLTSNDDQTGSGCSALLGPGL
jgi:hypothetical protein